MFSQNEAVGTTGRFGVETWACSVAGVHEVPRRLDTLRVVTAAHCGRVKFTAFLLSVLLLAALRVRHSGNAMPDDERERA